MYKLVYKSDDAADGSGAGPVSGDGASRQTHRASVIEHGAFAHAACSCGWRGPARRSRERARRDAQEHLAAGRAG